MKKLSFIATCCLSTLLVFTMTLVPMKQVVPVTHAMGGGLATWWEQHVQTLLQTTNNASAAVTAGGVSSLVTKEALDGIAWAVAKQMVANMTKSMVEWINSGFQGSPAFVTDLRGFLLDTLDTTAGEYIKSLGGIGEFICSPFKLDVQAALQINYEQARSGMPSGPTACKLSDIGHNIQDFLSGASSDMGQWLQVTSNPQNTPYGAYLDAEAKMNVKLVNAKGEQLNILDWNKGFYSKMLCEGINGKPAPKGAGCMVNGKITTPGAVIADAINYQLHTGTEALVTADEINEIIGALLNQLTLQAMQGLNGLLGLGGNSSYTDYSYGNGSNTVSYIDAANAQQAQISGQVIRTQVGTSLATEESYYTLATTTLAVANLKLDLINKGQAAIDALLHESVAANIGITGASTLADAQTKLNNASSSHLYAAALFDEVQSQLNEVRDSITVIAAVSPTTISAAELTALPFNTLKSDGEVAKNQLISLVNEVTPIVMQIQTALIAMKNLTRAYDAATTTSSSTDATRQQIAIDYISLVQSGAIISETALVAKRTEWNSILN